jgi:ubiquinone/menaquinone biosynthesis C-methylase UbiE
LVELGLVWDLNDSRAQLPIPAESFDYALCVSGVGYLSDVRRAVYEMHRVVKPGGSLVLGFDHQFVSSAVDPRWAVTTQDDRIRTVKLALADAACVTPEECTTYLRRVRHARPIEEWKYTFLQVRKPL